MRIRESRLGLRVGALRLFDVVVRVRILPRVQVRLAPESRPDAAARCRTSVYGACAFSSACCA